MQAFRQLFKIGKGALVSLVKIEIRSFRQIKIIFDAMQSGINYQDESEIRVGGRVGGTQLSPAVFAYGGRNPYELGAVFA